MKFTKAANMGLHVMVFLAKNENSNEHLSIHDLAEKFDVSSSYLSKILTQLAKAKLVSSVSGVKGGYKLKKSATEISFLDVIEAIDGLSGEASCLANNPHKCSISEILDTGEKQMWTYFSSVKLSQLKSL